MKKKILNFLIYFSIINLSITLASNAKTYNCNDFTKFALNKVNYEKIKKNEINIFREKDELKKIALEICKEEVEKDNGNVIKNFNYAFVLFANKKFEEGKIYLDYSSKQEYHGAQLYTYLARDNGWINYDDTLVEANLQKSAEQGNFMAIFLKAQKFIAEEEYLKAEEYFNKIKFYLPAVIYLRILEIPKNVENLEHVKDIIKFIRENVDKDYEHKFDITKGDIYSTTAAFLMNNGMSYLSVDFLKEAIKIEDETDQDEFIIPAYKQKNKESPTMIFNYQMLGFIYDDLGDFIKSEENYLRALSLYSENKDYIDEYNPSFYPNLLNLIGNLYSGLGDKAKAKKFVKESIFEFEKKNSQDSGYVMSIGNLGIYSDDREEKSKFLKLHLDLVKKKNMNPHDRLNAIYSLIRFHLEDKNLLEAERILNYLDEYSSGKRLYHKLLFQRLKIEIDIYKNDDLAKNKLIQFNFDIDQQKKNLDFMDYYYLKSGFFNLCKEILEQSTDEKIQTECKNNLFIFIKELINHIKDFNDINDQYIGLINSFSPIFLYYLSLNEYDENIHFQVSQILSFSEIDFASINLSNRTNSEDNSIKEIQQISYDIKYLKNSFKNDFSEKLINLEKVKKNKIDKLNIKNFSQNIKIYELVEIQKKIKKNEHVILFIDLNDKEVLRVHVTSTHYNVSKIIFDKDYKIYLKKIRSSFDNFDNLNRIFHYEEADYLNNKLFKDLTLDKNSIILIKTNSVLNSIPFNILGNFDKNKKFIFNYEEYNFYNLASLTYFFDNQSHSNNESFFGLANPIFSLEKNTQKNNSSEYVNLLYRGFKEDLSLKSLPNTENEVLSVSKYFKKNFVKILSKSNATEKNIKEINLNSYNYLIFATHSISFTESGNNEFTGLALTTPRQISLDDNGFLTAKEILKLKLNSKLVLLSACNTALDNDNRTYSGLVNSFIFAGSSAVISSHWFIETNSTEKITTDFFKYFIKDKLIASKSLRNSIDSFRKNYPNYDHPMFWGAFSITVNQRI